MVKNSMEDSRESIFVRYLRWANFSTIGKKPVYTIQLSVDSAIAILFSITSIVLIFMQEAGPIVLILNLLCLIRSILDNNIKASNVTRSKTPDNMDITQRHQGNSFYHIRLISTAGSLFFMTVALVCMYQEINETMIRAFSTITILIILWGDIEDNIISAYSAVV